MDRLSRPGRVIRVALTAAGLAALFAGSVWGSDDHFPFGPFSMFAGSNPPDRPAPDPRVEGVERDGDVIVLNERNAGIRRAEIEGQHQRYAADPGLLREVVEAYRRRNPSADELVEVRIVVRWHEIRGSRPTGEWTDDVVVRWRHP